MNKALIFAALLLLAPAPALAQQGPPSPPPVAVLSGAVALSAGVASSNVQLPSASPFANTVTIYNASATIDAFVKLGATIAVVATTSSLKIPAGKHITFYSGANQYVAGITASSTAALTIFQSNGPIAFGP